MSTTAAAQPQDDVEPAPNPVVAALRDWGARVRGGDVGSVPAVLGFLVLVLFFSAMRPETFASALNAANLLNQSAGVIFIAMGLVFVLLLGEIDLSAGFAAGTSAATLAVLLTEHHVNWPLSVAACLATGAVIGSAIGMLVAWLGIPSFVVTLAFFLGLQGVMLLVIGEGGTIPVNDDTILKIMNNNLSPLQGWILAALVVGGFAALLFGTAARRSRAGLPAQAASVMLAKIVLLAAIVGAGTYLLNRERAVNPLLQSLKGVPVIVPITLVVVVALTFVLNRTSFGRHVMAVGGNAEAARRAGINVMGIRIACFVIGSTLAAFAGVIFASRDHSVSPTTGGSQTLLYAVGAAVIGGTSLFGGKGRIIDAILGGLVVAVIQNGLPMITQKAGIQYIVTGLVLLLAASVDALSRRRASATGR